MASKVILEDAFTQVQTIGGIDVSYNRYDPEQRIYAATVALDLHTLELAEEAGAVGKQVFPYIPGLLGFREIPVMLEAFQRLKRRPDVLMVDGHGISHPRGLGIASHLGVLLDIPTIGVAKSILVGKAAESLSAAAESQVSLVWKGREIGILYRTKTRANPLIISVGHRVSLRAALSLVKECLKGYRLPEPTRQAHLAANRYRKLVSIC